MGSVGDERRRHGRAPVDTVALHPACTALGLPPRSEVRRFHRLALLTLAVVAARAHRDAAAQNPPVRLPAVVVNAAPDLPGPRRIAGVVRDTTGFPVEGVEVSIPALQRRASSGPDGSFRFDNVAPGTYPARARKLGFGPQVHSVVVDSLGGAVAFALVPIPHTLLPIVSSAARGGLSGVVGDTAFRAIPGALVRLTGHGASSATDSLGEFFIPAKPGSYLVSVTRPGFAFRLVSVIIPADSGRRITAYLPPAPPVSNREAHNLDDLAARLAWRSTTRSRVFTRADLEKLNVEWAWDAVRFGYGAIFQGRNGWVDRDCSVIVNGGPQTTELGSLTIDDIETVEIYTRQGNPSRVPDIRSARGGVVRTPSHASVPSIPLSNTERATMENKARECPIVYVWLR